MLVIALIFFILMYDFTIFVSVCVLRMTNARELAELIEDCVLEPPGGSMRNAVDESYSNWSVRFCNQYYGFGLLFCDACVADCRSRTSKNLKLLVQEMALLE